MNSAAATSKAAYFGPLSSIIDPRLDRRGGDKPLPAVGHEDEEVVISAWIVS